MQITTSGKQLIRHKNMQYQSEMIYSFITQKSCIGRVYLFEIKLYDFLHVMHVKSECNGVHKHAMSLHVLLLSLDCMPPLKNSKISERGF